MALRRLVALLCKVASYVAGELLRACIFVIPRVTVHSLLCGRRHDVNNLFS